MTAPTPPAILTPLAAAHASGALGVAGKNRLQIHLRDLLQGASELQIVHQDEVYTLRLTRNNKLILTK